jgi:hypothetical protein
MKPATFVLFLSMGLLTTSTQGPNLLEVEPLTNETDISTPPIPSKEGELETIVFEALPRVKLSLSSFQVISIFSFRPFEETLLKMAHYTRKLAQDIEYYRYARADPVSDSVSRMQVNSEMGPALKTLKAITQGKWHQIYSMGQEYLDILDLFHDHPGTPEKDSSQGLTRQLINTFRCTDLLMPNFDATPVDHRASHTPTGMNLFCSCMGFYQLTKDIKDDCPQIDPRIYQDYLDNPSKQNPQPDYLKDPAEPTIRLTREPSATTGVPPRRESPDKILRRLRLFEPTSRRSTRNLHKEVPQDMGSRTEQTQRNEGRNERNQTSKAPERKTIRSASRRRLIEAGAEWHHFIQTRSTRSLMRIVGNIMPWCGTTGIGGSLEMETLCSLLAHLSGQTQQIHRRKKRFVWTAMLAAYTFSKFKFTDKTIRKLKDNIQTLDQNTQRNREDLLKAYNMLNLTLIEVGQHRTVLHKLERASLQNAHIIESLTSQARSVTAVHILLSEFNHRTHVLENAVGGFGREVGKFYQYLAAISTQRINPEMLPPTQLHTILEHVQEKLIRQPRLSLLGYPNTSIWDFYQYVKIIPTIVEDHLVVALQIPLSDTLTQLNLYKVHNFPLLHPQLGLKFQYQIEAGYLATHLNRTYYLMPGEDEVTLCRASHGNWCRITSPMISVKQAPNCLISLFLRNSEMINQLCGIKVTPQAQPTAVLWKPHTWVVSILRPTTLYIHCLLGEEKHKILPPHAVVTLPPSCSAYVGNSLYLPPAASLNMEISPEALARKQISTELVYKDLKDFRIVGGWEPKRLTEEQLNDLSTKLLDYDTIPLPKLQETLAPLDYNYPKQSSALTWIEGAWDKAGPLILGIGIPLVILIGIVFICYKYPAARAVGTGLLGTIQSRLNTPTREEETKPKSPNNRSRTDPKEATKVEMKPLRGTTRESGDPTDFEMLDMPPPLVKTQEPTAPRESYLPPPPPIVPDYEIPVPSTSAPSLPIEKKAKTPYIHEDSIRRLKIEAKERLDLVDQFKEAGRVGPPTAPKPKLTLSKKLVQRVSNLSGTSGFYKVAPRVDQLEDAPTAHSSSWRTAGKDGRRTQVTLASDPLGVTSPTSGKPAVRPSTVF